MTSPLGRFGAAALILLPTLATLATPATSQGFAATWVAHNELIVRAGGTSSKLPKNTPLSSGTTLLANNILLRTTASLRGADGVVPGDVVQHAVAHGL